MITLVGPAGVGKTRLAVEYAAAAQSHSWLVRLVDIHGAESIATAVAATIGLPSVAGDPALAVQRALADRTGLLVLDNCEHLIDQLPNFVLPLLDSAPSICIVATSRQPTAIEGEHIMAVAPLPIDATDGTAVELLADRVSMHHANWEPSVGDLAAARAICAALDGLPLAIELAATRERVHGLANIAIYLRDRIDVLAPIPRGSLSPHVSLEAAIAWSVDQLDDADRRLLLRLWPFEDGFTWDAAAAVSPSGTAVLAGLAGLVDRSVLTADTASGHARYRMLETIRIYCRGIDPEPDATREAHAQWVRTLAVEQAALLTGPRSGEATRTLIAELANIRAGIAYDLSTHPECALRTAGALGYLWVTSGTIGEGLALTTSALQACPDSPVEDRAAALIGLSICAMHAGDHAAAIRHADTVLEILTPANPAHEVLLAFAHSRKCNALAQIADHATLREAHASFRAAVAGPAIPDHLRVNSRLGVGLLQFRDGDVQGAIDTLNAAHDMAGRCGYLWGAGMTDQLLGWCLLGRAGSDTRQTRTTLGLLARAATAFVAQPNASDLISTMFAGACALADLGHDDAADLYAAVSVHAHRIGANPYRYVPLAGDTVRERMDRLAALKPAHEGTTPSWEETVDLFLLASADSLADERSLDL